MTTHNLVQLRELAHRADQRYFELYRHCARLAGLIPLGPPTPQELTSVEGIRDHLALRACNVEELSIKIHELQQEVGCAKDDTVQEIQQLAARIDETTAKHLRSTLHEAPDETV